MHDLAATQHQRLGQVQRDIAIEDEPVARPQVERAEAACGDLIGAGPRLTGRQACDVGQRLSGTEARADAVLRQDDRAPRRVRPIVQSCRAGVDHS